MTKFAVMIKKLSLLLLFFQLSGWFFQPVAAQCSICTKSAQQMGERPAKALNAGIIYLAIAPLAIFGFIGYKWWKHNGQHPG
jgi:hypothetical protein